MKDKSRFQQIRAKYSPVKISHLQLMSLLAISAVFSVTTALPGMNDYSMSRFISLVISKGFMFLIYVPLLIFTAKSKDNVLKAADNDALKWFFGCVILVRLLYSALIAALQLNFFVTKTIMPYLTPAYFMAILFLGVLYGTHKGIQGTARIAPISLVLYIFVITIVSLMVWREFEVIRLYSPFASSTASDVFSRSFTDVIRNDEIFFFAVLSGFVRGKPEDNPGNSPKKSTGNKNKCPGLSHRSVLYYLPLVLIILMWLNVLYNAVLGRLMQDAEHPLYTVASLVALNLIERLDGILVTLQIIAGMLKVTLCFICVRAVVSELIGAPQKQPRERKAKITASILLAGVGVSAFFLVGNEEHALLNGLNILFIITLIVAALLLPVTALIFKGKEKADNEKIPESVPNS